MLDARAVRCALVNWAVVPYRCLGVHCMQLHETVVDCVNEVGCDVQTASVALLRHVCGLNLTRAQAIRDASIEGSIGTRADLRRIKGVGPRAWVQAAGFLRVPTSSVWLDRTSVHPDDYNAAESLLAAAGFTLDDVGRQVGHRLCCDHSRWRLVCGLQLPVGQEYAVAVKPKLAQLAETLDKTAVARKVPTHPPAQPPCAVAATAMR